MNNSKKSFIRWQAYVIKQMSFVNNLIIGLSAGVLIYQMKLIYDKVFTQNVTLKYSFVASISLDVISSFVGCWLALNRLLSFRKTAQIARKKEKNESDNINSLRENVEKIDKRTWRLLIIQSVSFYIAVTLLIVISVYYYLT